MYLNTQQFSSELSKSICIFSVWVATLLAFPLGLKNLSLSCFLILYFFLSFLQVFIYDFQPGTITTESDYVFCPSLLVQWTRLAIFMFVCVHVSFLWIITIVNLLCCQTGLNIFFVFTPSGAKLIVRSVRLLKKRRRNFFVEEFVVGRKTHSWGA